MSPRNYVIGIDLSGPTNTRDTAFACFEVQGESLFLVDCFLEAGDRKIYEETQKYTARGEVVVGLDAPLSYNPGGGDRPADRDLRGRIQTLGMSPGSVMTPTMTRMAYLTLRGMAVARLLNSNEGAAAIRKWKMLRIVEVHPGAAMIMRHAPVADVTALKRDAAAQNRLLVWLAGKGLQGLKDRQSDHMIAAYAAALAAWKWSVGEPRWVTAADPPLHPFDFAC